MTRVLLVGCGKMGSALLAGWLERGLDPAGIVVVEPGPVAASGVTVVASHDRVPQAFAPDVVVLAVKPQVMAVALPPYARY